MVELSPFLQNILDQGWTDAKQKRFVQEYGTILRRSILYQLRRHFGSEGLAAVARYLESMQTGAVMKQSTGLDQTYLDLAVNVWQDVLTNVFRSDVSDGLIGKFSNYHEQHNATETSFEGFLRQNIRFKFLDQLPQKISQKEVLDKIIDLEKDKDRHYYIQEARNRYSDTVAENIRSRFSNVDTSQMNDVVDYFFEVFISENYSAVRGQIDASQPRGQMLNRLLDQFSESHLKKAFQHQRQVYGHRGGITAQDDKHIERVADVQEISVADETDVYWDLLLRCQQPSTESIEADLLNIKLNRATALCWSCAKLKTESPRADTKENIIAFIAFYCSQNGPQRETESLPERASVSLEAVSGRYLRWEEDICGKIFKKNIRKDRVMDMVIRTLSESPYQHLLQQKEGQA